MQNITIPTTVIIHNQPLSHRPFRGIGAQADAYIFDEANRSCGVNEEDLELIARRIRYLKLSNARLFVEVAWFNPSLDGTTLVWDQPGYLNLVRQIQLLRETGTAVNLVLFSPYPGGGKDLVPIVQAMLAAIERLVRIEGCTHIRWLTLWNEPDGLFYHDSPLYRRIFGEEARTTKPPWAEYVRLNRLAYDGLLERGLHSKLKLLVADTVWGAPMRAERLRLSLAAFGELDVAYSIHNYSIEERISYEGNEDFAYLGMAAEVASFRELLGPDRELVMWEFNTVGLEGFSTISAGVGRGGEEQIGSFKGAVDLADKVLSGLASGLDGCCLWCLHDMPYCGSLKSGAMPFGLWRYRWQKWLPRPIYHYYSALIAAFRPGAQLFGVQNTLPDLRALAATCDGIHVLALLNTGLKSMEVQVPWTGPASRLRIVPGQLPAACDLPFSTFVPVEVVGGHLQISLEPQELTIVRTHKAPRVGVSVHKNPPLPLRGGEPD